MSAVIDEDRAPRLGLAVGFAEGPPGGGADLWRRLWFTLGALIVYRLGTYLPIPGIDPVAASEFFRASQGGIIGLLDMFAGGGIRRFSIFALGIMPYVSAFIMLQFAGVIAPGLRRLAAEGPTGRRALNQYARILTIAVAGLQAVGFAVAFESVRELVASPGHAFEVLAVVALAAGAILLMWLAEQITERGVGFGVLAILACGIASGLPFGISRLFEQVKTGDLDVHVLLVVPLVSAAVVALVAVVESAVRRIPIHGPGGEVGIDGAVGGYPHLTLRLNPTGILAPLAASVMAAPLWGIARALGGRDAPWLERLAGSGIGYVLVEGLLIFFFAGVFGLAIFDPGQIAMKAPDSGGQFSGFRTDDSSARQLRWTQAVLALTGAVYLVVVCVLPSLIYRALHLVPPLGGIQLFLLAWVMVRFLEWARPILRQ
jgi:preprotein translocase subunit SecY